MPERIIIIIINKDSDEIKRFSAEADNLIKILTKSRGSPPRRIT